MIEQYLPGLFDVEQRLIGNEAYDLRVGIEFKERLGVSFDEFPKQQAISLENYFHE
jgi:hypothetical protein